MGLLSEVRIVAGRAVRAARLEVHRYRRDRRSARRVRGPVHGDVTLAPPVALEVVVHFPDPPENLYQLQQWLPILAQLDDRHRVGILCRHSTTADLTRKATSLPVVLLHAFRDLEPFYVRAGAKVCLGVNNHHRNFQSLAFTDQPHVHLNHGESDKASMASNQAKAYDRVLVAGAAAAERYRDGLLDYDDRRLVMVGRPQLDLVPAHRLATDGRPTVLYALTWEGGRDAMDYSSVAAMGPALVEELLRAGLRVVYRPHPKTGVERSEVAAANRRTTALVESADRRVGHRVSRDEPVGAAYARADVLIADVSSILLDFLATGRPLLATRPGGAGRRLATSIDVDAVVDVVTPDDVPDVGARVRRLLTDDPREADRLAVAERLFGDTSPGTSTARFLDAIDAIVADRDRLVSERRSRVATRRAPPVRR